MNLTPLRIFAAALAVAGFARTAPAVDFHVATAQDLQNALTLSAANGADNIVYLAGGFYTGNFNFNSTGGHNLALQNESGVTNNAIVLDGAGTGRGLNLVNTGNAGFIVRGVTFLRDCADTSQGALSISGGNGSSILIDGCSFPAGGAGIGVLITSGLNAILTNCTVIGADSGDGMDISGVTGNVTVQSCVVATNSYFYINYDCYCPVRTGGNEISGAGQILVTNNSIIGNDSFGLYGTSVIVAGNTFESSEGNNYHGGSVGMVANGTTITLTGNTFYGNSDSGGSCSGTTVTIFDNTFENNGGDGLDCSGNVSISQNVFVGNSDDGLALNGPSAIVAGNVFENNVAQGVAFGGNSLTLSNNTFVANNGGGAYVGGNAFVCGNTFSRNSSHQAGGGLYYGNTGNGASQGLLTLIGNTFKQNSSDGQGGGVYAVGPVLVLQDNLLANNSSSQGGGAWVNTSLNLFMINNTVFGNQSTGTGGGAAFEVDGTVELLNVYNNIIWGNSAAGNGVDVWLAGTGQQKLFLYNDVHDMYGVWDIAQNLVDAEPNFFDPVNGDYHLRPGSPCANFGTNGAPYLPATDLEGNARTNNAGLVDLGCYEFNTSATHPADTNAVFVITSDEFNAYAAAWKTGQVWANGPNPISADYLTRAGYLMTNGGAYHNDGSMRPVNWKTGP